MASIDGLRELLRSITQTAITTLADSDDRRGDGERDGQYALDLLVDGPLVGSLLDAGLGVLSEEAGVINSERSLLAIVDPVDGSTNASRRIPWFATSIAIVDDDGPVLSLVENHVTRERFEAVRGGGAFHNGIPMSSPVPGALSDAVVGVNGVPPANRPWAQFRTLGASALDINYVASGSLDAYVDFDDEAHGVWDYLGAFLVCAELGVPIADAFGRELVHRDHTARRTPVVAHSSEVLEQLVELRRSESSPPAN